MIHFDRNNNNNNNKFLLAICVVMVARENYWLVKALRHNLIL